ncbi:MAG: CoA transferase [Gemmatimonadaceae bacterium]|nr:CoA transferase [Gemmatimonadaceae bacterium]
MNTLPLEGIRVLDLSRVLAGPLCSMTLGDLGARVIKVERPESGDDTRGWGPPFADDGQSAYFRSINRNKLSIALDLRRSDDSAVLRRLLSEADVVLENFLPGQLAGYGLDRDALMAANGGLIWCSITGFGAASRRPGYDFVVQAESGWMAITGEVDGAPVKTGVALVDVITGKDAATAILAALVGRERKMPARRLVELSLASSAVAALVNIAQNVLVSGAEAGRWGNAHPNLVPYQLFEAQDRPFVLAVGNDAQWRAAASVLGLDERAGEPALATNAGRVGARARVVAAIAARVATAPAAWWTERLDGVGVPCGLVRSVKDALASVDASPVTGVAPLGNGRVRYVSPSLNEHQKIIRQFYWSSFDHLPIPTVRTRD